MTPVEARYAVWGHVREIDWSQYTEVPDELVDGALDAFYDRFGWAAPVDCAEDMVMAITGDADPDTALAFSVMQLMARALDGRKLPRDPDPADLPVFATAVAFVRGIRAKQTELEEL